MLKLILIFLAFGFGATLGYYVPFGTRDTDLRPTILPSLDGLWIPSKDAGYRRTFITGVIETIDYDTSKMTLSYYPGYAPGDKKLIRLHFDAGMRITDQRIEKQNGIIIFWEPLQEALAARALTVGNVVGITFKYNEATKMLLAASITLVWRNVSDI